MPRLGGVEAMRAMRQVMPSLPIVLSSGFSGAGTIDRLGNLGARGLLIQKPYRMDDLLGTIRSMIGEAAASS